MEGINYQVNTFLQTHGSFDREVTSAAKSADAFAKSWVTLGDRMTRAGEGIRGTFGSFAADFGKGGAMAIGGSIVAGIGAATVAGVKYNDTMEQGALGLATMYQTFGVAEGIEKNVELAKAFQHELVAIADASPGTTEDMMLAYSTAAPAMSAVTQDLMRQKEVMEKLSTMAWASAGSYQQMGADFGRIITGAAGLDTAMFKTLAEPIKAAYEEITGETAKTGEQWTQQWNKAVMAGGDIGLKVMEKVLGNVPPEFAEAFGQSFGGVLASVESKMQKLAGDFGNPLFESGREAMSRLMSEGAFSRDAFRSVAIFGGNLLARAFDSSAGKLMAGLEYVADNWQDIALTFQKAAAIAAVGIKAAIAVGLTRHFIGSAVIAGGSMAKAFGDALPAMKGVGEWLSKQTKATHVALTRGALGEGKGLLGRMGAGMESVAVKTGLGGGLVSGLGGKEKTFDKWMLKVGALATTVGSLGFVAVAAATAIGTIGVVIGGVTAYFVDNWDRISGSIIRGLEDGTITLVPLMTSLYTFYGRLVMVGEALLGGSDATSTVNSGLSVMVSVVDAVSGSLGWFVYGLSIMVGAWGAIKLAMLGVAKVMMGWIYIANSLGAVSDESLAKAGRRLEEFDRGVDDTFHTADMLATASEKISSAKLSELDFSAAEEKARKLEGSLVDALKGVDKDKDKKGRSKGGKVKIEKVVVEVDLRDDDPDRLFASFIPKLERMADKRLQPYETIEEGS